MKKLLAMLLTLAMLVLAVPAMSFAETATDAATEDESAQLEMLMQLLGALGAENDTEDEQMSEEDGAAMASLFAAILQSMGGEEGAGAAEGEQMSGEDMAALMELFAAMGDADGTEATEAAEETAEAAEGEEMSEEDTAALTELFTALFDSIAAEANENEADGEPAESAEAETAESASEEEASGLDGLLGAVLGGLASELPQPDSIAAETVDQFYGSWKLDRVEMAGGVVLSPEMLSDFDLSLAAQMTISADGVTIAVTANEESNEEAIESAVEFRDGSLYMTSNDETLKYDLTGEGELVCSIKLANVYFVKAE